MRRAAIVLAVLALASQARAADFAVVDGLDGRPAIRMWGDIEPDDTVKFADFVRSHPQAFSLVLSGEGGALDPAVRIGTFAHSLHLWTVVAAGADCASACAYIWAAGTTRTVEAGGHVGFHGAFTMENGVPAPSSDGNAILGSYLGRIGYSDGAISYMTSKPPAEMQWLTAPDAHRYGIDYAEQPHRPPISAIGAVTPSE